MKTKWHILFILMAVAVMNTGCFFLSSTPTTNYDPEPTVDYAPQNIRSGAYIEFEHPSVGLVHIVFQTQNTADLAACSAANGRINAAYYRYDGFNKASLTFNYSPNGGMTSQYKAELNFRRESGGNIEFLGTDQKASFKYRP